MRMHMNNQIQKNIFEIFFEKSQTKIKRDDII